MTSTVEQVKARVLSTAFHVGSGMEQVFAERENLLHRPVAARSFAADELVDLA